VIEAEFRRLIVDPDRGIAPLLGYVHASFRPARTAHGWRTPVEGQLGPGWPDLTLLRLRDGRLVFAELKGDGSDGKKPGKLTPDEERVLEWLRRCPGVEVYVWWPRDLDEAARILAR
jgi:hypothetical protein